MARFPQHTRSPLLSRYQPAFAPTPRERQGRPQYTVGVDFDGSNLIVMYGAWRVKDENLARVRVGASIAASRESLRISQCRGA